MGWAAFFCLLVADGVKRHRKKKFEDLFESPLYGARMSEQTKETCPFSELKIQNRKIRTSDDYVSDDNTVALMP